MYFCCNKIMAGLYIHIPFCRQRCIYCDFYSSTNTGMKNKYVDILCKEISDRRDYLNNEPFRTIYFGGGTPSLFSGPDFEKLFNQMREQLDFSFKNSSDNNSFYDLLKTENEITLEGNPDDISSEYLDTIKDLPFNRISMGVQSFDDDELKFLNRRHDARSAIDAVKRCRTYELNNISIDLIYGLPGQTLERWKSNLKQAIDLNVPHISAYNLIVEPETALNKLIQTGKFFLPEEECNIQMFEIMIDLLQDAGYEHYEISNFAKPGYYSKHNSSYWNGQHYLGIGASAHSYNGKSRQWNINSLSEYCNSNPIPVEIESIDSRTAYNDFIMTRLRTAKGIYLPELEKLFGDKMKTYCLNQAEKYILQDTLHIENEYLQLKRSGIFISDRIISDLMFV